VYAVAERIFTFDLSDTVSPVTAFTVTQDSPRPWMVLSWTSSTAPDAFAIQRDGETVFVTADATDLLVSGTSYEWVDREAAPEAEHTWTVLRIVNGVTSDDNPTVTASYSSVGVWICTTDGAHAFNIAGDQGQVVRWDADELVSLYRPFGASRVHLVTQSVFGRAGSVAGYADPFPGETTADVRAEIDAMRDRDVYPYGTPLVLTMVDTVTRIIWYGVVVDERSEFGDEIGIRFNLNEIGA
jgi:hypothetical protein